MSFSFENETEKEKKQKGITMARPKKNGTYINLCIDNAVYDHLVRYCEESGNTKTAAVERALTAYFDDFDRKQEMLKKIEEK